MTQDNRRHNANSHRMLPNSSILPVTFKTLLLQSTFSVYLIHTCQDTFRVLYAYYAHCTVLGLFILTPKTLSRVMLHFLAQSSCKNSYFDQTPHRFLLQRNTHQTKHSRKNTHDQTFPLSKPSNCKLHCHMEEQPMVPFCFIIAACKR